jgi:hypothetical protein
MTARAASAGHSGGQRHSRPHSQAAQLLEQAHQRQPLAFRLASFAANSRSSSSVHGPSRGIGSSSAHTASVLDGRIAKAEARMAALTAADPELADINRRLKTVPGVGPIVAARAAPSSMRSGADW